MIGRNKDPEAERVLQERFGKDTVIALATTENGDPHVRYVNAHYEHRTDGRLLARGREYSF